MSEINKLLAAFAESVGKSVSLALQTHEEKIERSIEELRQILREHEKASAQSQSSYAEQVEKRLNSLQEELSKSITSAGDVLDASKSYADELLLGLRQGAAESPSVEEVVGLAAKALEPEITKWREDESATLQRLFKQLQDSMTIPEPPEVLHGRDALDIEILPSIDASKSYPRGTYAMHDGGVFRSFQKTNGMHGWECLVRGVKSVTPYLDGKKGMLTVTLSDGTVEKAETELPSMQYQDIYRRGKGYAIGDCVTWGGSLWLAKRATEEADEPGKSDAWQLAVKRGGDGRGLYAIAKDNGFKGSEKDLFEQIMSGKQHQNIVRLKDGN